MNTTEFDAFRQYLRQVCGLNLPDDRLPRVSEIVCARMETLGLTRFQDYYCLLTSSKHGQDEFDAIATLVTTGETYFFRNADHWRALQDCVLPWILERNEAAPPRRIRLWSAGCSTGEEAYTMAMVLSNNRQTRRGVPCEIVGTDINPAAINAARRALYTEHAFRGVRPAIRQQYFESAGEGCYRPRDEIRSMVRFQVLNLLDTTDTPQLRDFDIVFCRNVLIYFDNAGKNTVIQCFHNRMRPGGFLFLGHAESIPSSSFGFANVHVSDTFLYKSIPRPTGSHTRSSSNQIVAPTARSGRTPLRNLVATDAARSPNALASEPSVAERQTVRCAQAAARPSKETLSRPVRDGNRAVPLATDTLRNRAIAQLCDSHNAEAQRDFEELLRRAPDDVEGLLGMALLLAGRGMSEAALECCRQVLNANPMSAEAYCAMALVHEGLNEDAAAGTQFAKAVYLDDVFSMAHFRLACLDERTGRDQAAAREFRNALRVLPCDSEQRVRLYSGGFDKDTIAGLCKQRLGDTILHKEDIVVV